MDDDKKAQLLKAYSFIVVSSAGKGPLSFKFEQLLKAYESIKLAFDWNDFVSITVFSKGLFPIVVKIFGNFNDYFKVMCLANAELPVETKFGIFGLVLKKK